MGKLHIVRIDSDVAVCTDWYYRHNTLSETLVGILVGAPIGWIASMNAYYFPSARNNGNGRAKSTNRNSEGTTDVAKSTG